MITHETANGDFSLYCKLHPFIIANRPQTQATISELTQTERFQELEYAHLAGEWRHPACGEDDKLMDVVRTQHQTTRSWQCDRVDPRNLRGILIPNVIYDHRQT